MRDKKAQAAMEFLMTYGWAILAAIIAIGVLYIIIGNPANLVGDRFSISDPFIALGKAASTTEVTIEVKNGAGEAVTISNVNIAATGCSDYTTSTPVAVDAAQVINVPCTSTAGSRVKGAVTITYTSAGSSVAQRASGTVNLKVA